MIGDVLGPGAARGIPEMVCQLAAERSLSDRLLESPDGGGELLDRQRPLTDELIENLWGNGCQRRLRRKALSSAGHGLSSC